MEDVFRKEQVPLTELQKDLVMQVKTKAENLLGEFIIASKTCGDPRLMAMAQSHLEITIMIAVKGITAPRVAEVPMSTVDPHMAGVKPGTAVSRPPVGMNAVGQMDEKQGSDSM